MSLRPPVDFVPSIAAREPTLDELVQAWDEREARRVERERRRLWDEQRAAVRRLTVDEFEQRDDQPAPAPGWLVGGLVSDEEVGPRARRALPAARPGRPVQEAGVDTWSPSWRLPEGSDAERAIRELLPREGHRGQVLPDAVEGHRVLWFAAARLLACEGHPSADGLGCPDDLPVVQERLRGSLVERLCADIDGRWDAGVRRLDATCDVPHGSPAEGLALLAGIAAVPIPGVQTVVRRSSRADRIETVELHGRDGRRILGRCYDKGVEAARGAPGTLIRLEDQRRYDASTRRSVSELTTQYVRGQWQRRFLPLWRATKGVKVAGPLVLAERIGELIETGELTPGQARAVAGFLLLDAAGIQQGSRKTRYRLRRVAAEAGLVLADGVMQEVEIDLGAMIEDVLESDAWTRRG